MTFKSLQLHFSWTTEELADSCYAYLCSKRIMRLLSVLFKTLLFLMILVSIAKAFLIGLTLMEFIYLALLCFFALYHKRAQQAFLKSRLSKHPYVGKQMSVEVHEEHFYWHFPDGKKRRLYFENIKSAKKNKMGLLLILNHSYWLIPTHAFASEEDLQHCLLLATS